MKGEWLHTEGVACIETDSRLVISDRLKGVIKTGGEWLSSLELESLISQHANVAAVAVVGVADERWGERPHALVVPKDFDQPISAELIQSHLQQYQYLLLLLDLSMHY